MLIELADAPLVGMPALKLKVSEGSLGKPSEVEMDLLKGDGSESTPFLEETSPLAREKEPLSVCPSILELVLSC